MLEILTAIIAFCKSISALQGLAALLERTFIKLNDKQSAERLVIKNDAVDTAIDNILRAHKIEQQSKTNATSGLPGGSTGSAGMDTRGIENNKSVGI